VTYEDGDVEELEIAELRGLLVAVPVDVGKQPAGFGAGLLSAEASAAAAEERKAAAPANAAAAAAAAERKAAAKVGLYKPNPVDP
jgi:hypothetical protein